MKYFLFGLSFVWSIAAFARNDFWMGSQYSVTLSFGADDLGKKNAPTPKRVVPPEFPAEMIQAAIAGDVIVDYTVASDGRVSDLVIINASAEQFRKEVSSTALTWLFNPAIELPTGKAVSARMRCRIRFSISEQEPNESLQPTAPSRRG